MSIKNYFKKEPENYVEWRSKGILGKIVSSEKKQILKLLDIKKNEKILDAGSGDGYYAILMKEKGAKIFGVDISANMIIELKKNGIKGKVSNIEELKFREKFDKILCAGAMEFLKSQEKAIDSFHSALKKKGTLVIGYPRKSFFGYLYKMYHKLRGTNIKLFSKHDFEELLSNKFYVTANQNSSVISAAIKARKK